MNRIPLLVGEAQLVRVGAVGILHAAEQLAMAKGVRLNFDRPPQSDERFVVGRLIAEHHAENGPAGGIIGSVGHELTGDGLGLGKNPALHEQIGQVVAGFGVLRVKLEHMPSGDLGLGAVADEVGNAAEHHPGHGQVRGPPDEVVQQLERPLRLPALAQEIGVADGGFAARREGQAALEGLLRLVEAAGVVQGGAEGLPRSRVLGILAEGFAVGFSRVVPALLINKGSGQIDPVGWLPRIECDCLAGGLLGLVSSSLAADGGLERCSCSAGCWGRGRWLAAAPPVRHRPTAARRH